MDKYNIIHSKRQAPNLTLMSIKSSQPYPLIHSLRLSWLQFKFPQILGSCQITQYNYHRNYGVTRQKTLFMLPYGSKETFYSKFFNSRALKPAAIGYYMFNFMAGALYGIHSGLYSFYIMDELGISQKWFGNCTLILIPTLPCFQF